MKSKIQTLFALLLTLVFHHDSMAQDKAGTHMMMYFENDSNLTQIKNPFGDIVYNNTTGELKMMFKLSDCHSADSTADSLIKQWDDMLIFSTVFNPATFRLNTDNNTSSTYTAFDGTMMVKNQKVRARGYYQLLRLSNAQNQTLYNTRLFAILNFDANALSCPLKSDTPVRLEILEGEINVIN